VKKKLNYGDIFYLEAAKGKYVFGRVLFNVDEQYVPHSNEEESNTYLDSYYGCQLVEIYKGIYDSSDYNNKYNEVLIPRAFVVNIHSKSNKVAWGKVGYKEVDYTKVEFPEVIGRSNNAIWLKRGELSFQLLNHDEITSEPFIVAINYPTNIVTSSLFLQGRKDLIKLLVLEKYMIPQDLYFYPEIRIKLYKEIGRDLNKSYYELSKEEGFDFSRFYNK
jgi:hypothetical protein